MQIELLSNCMACSAGGVMTFIALAKGLNQFFLPPSHGRLPMQSVHHPRDIAG